KFYSKPTNNNLRTSSTSQSANKKQEFVKTDDKKVEKKADEKKRDMSRVKFYNCKKEGHFAKDYKKAKANTLIAEKRKVSKSKEKVVVSLDSEGNKADDFSELKKITALLAKAFNRRKFYSKPTNNNLRTSSTSQSTNKKQEFVKTDNKKVEKKDDEKKGDMSRASSSSADEKIFEVSYYLSESESEYEFKTSEYYDNSTNYGLFVNNDDDQEIFHDAIEYASENLIENYIDSQKDYDKSDVDHNDSEEKDHLVDKLIRKFNKKIVKCQKWVEKENQQSKDFENQNKDLQDKYDVLKNQATTFEINNKELNEQLKELIEKNNDLLAQTKVLKEELQVKHVVIDTHVECHEKYAKHEIADQEVLYDKMSVQLVEMDKHVRDLKNTVLEKDFKISELEECVRNKDLEIEKCLERLNGIGFENPSYFEKAKDLRPTLYDEKVIGLGDNPDFEKIDSPFQQTSSLKLYVSNVILEKIIIDLEDEVVNLLEKEKANMETIESLKSKGFESSENVISESENQNENDCHLNEHEQNKVENPNVIAPGMFKLNVSQCVLPISMSKSSYCPDLSLDHRFKMFKAYDGMPQQNGVVERRNRTLVEAARTMLTFANLPSFLWAEAITTACFTQNRSIIHKRLDKTPYELMNKRKQNIKFFYVFGCRCYLLNDYEDIHVSVNVNFDELSEMAPKQFSLEPGLSNLNETGKSSNPSVSQVSETSKKDLEDLFQDFYDEYFDSSKIMKSSTTNVETSINEEVFHEVSELFQGESSSSSLNDDVQQSPEGVILPQTNTQSISNNMVPNGDEESTSQNVFNERLEDAYFDASTPFHDPSNVHTFYQPYPHEKKWTKDHPLHKIIAEALRDADWVSAMQEELDQFARLNVWRLVPRPEGKSVIKTK
nr:retrovirus-related Pol polyprotein from transposon TNT 1-94 [Tanacetum cinerariifolium]